MTWKLMHKLFGWDYIAWDNRADNGVARIHRGGQGKPWYYRYKLTSLVDQVNHPNEVIWLTCHPSKYFQPIDPLEGEVLPPLVETRLIERK